MPNILHRVGIQASPTAVYKALTTQNGLAGWWNRPDAEGTKLGARMCFIFKNGGPTMEVTELTPLKRVIWRCVDGPEEWLNTRLAFTSAEPGRKRWCYSVIGAGERSASSWLTVHVNGPISC